MASIFNAFLEIVLNVYALHDVDSEDEIARTDPWGLFGEF